MMEIRHSGLAHLKQLQGTDLCVFLGPCVSDHSTAQDVEDAEAPGHPGHVCAPPDTGIKYFYEVKPGMEAAR